MKKIVILAVVGLFSFVLGTVGLYVAMPKLAPAVVDSTRVKLDSLGLISSPPKASLREVGEAISDSLLADSSATGDSLSAVRDSVSEAPEHVIGQLSDSLDASAKLAQNLEQSKSSLLTQIEQMKKQIAKLESRKLEAAELSKSIAKLEDDQLGDLLAGIELDVIETLYLQSSARDRTRLLQNMAPDRAAVFVRSLVKGTPPPTEVAAKATDQPVQNGPSNQ